MKVVFLKNNINSNYKLNNSVGYRFKPRKNIDSLVIYNNEMIKYILNKKIRKDINNCKKSINLMLKSNITLVSDCDMMVDELKRIANVLENKYMKYFNEFEYFDLVKEIYNLNMEILTKKKLIESK